MFIPRRLPTGFGSSLASRIERNHLVTDHVVQSLRQPFSASTFRMAPVPVVIIGKNPKIASKVREGLLPEYDGMILLRYSHQPLHSQT